MVEKSIAVLEDPPRLELSPSGSEIVPIIARIPPLANLEQENSFRNYFEQQIWQNCEREDCSAKVAFESRRRFFGPEIRQLISATMICQCEFCPRRQPGSGGDHEPLDPILPESDLCGKVLLPV